MNWIKFGWGSSFSVTFTKNATFNVSFKNSIKSESSLLEISNRAIKDVVNNYPPPYTLMVSGGVDSQSMLWLWLQSKVPFTAVSVKYISPDRSIWFNEHDLHELRLFCDKHNIPIEYKEFNVISFFEDTLHEYANKYQCNSPQICTHMAISELIPSGTVIFSGNFASQVPYTYTIWGLKRYADITNRPMIPYFLLHDAELSNVIQLERKITDHVTSQDNYLDKVKSLHEIGIPVIPQPTKQTGFEKIKEYYDQFPERITFMDRIKYGRMPSKRVFDILFRYRIGDKIPYQDKVIYHRNEN